MKKYALISVSDKAGVVEFAKGLCDLGFEIISTGGTASALSAAGIANIGISDITGFPECLDGRVKTLHPNVHAGLLAMRANPEHMEQLKKLNINTIDLVAVNLYPFKNTVANPDVKLEDAIENIDIGGPTMLRSAAKNYQDVVVVVDPTDYSEVLDKLKNNTVDLNFKFNLMYKVFQHTAVYDTLIANFMAAKLSITYPPTIAFAYEKVQDLRYGENPHQKAAFYRDCFNYDGSIAFAKQLNGKELSYNNINDANGALDLLREFDMPAAVAIKHANPCGVGIGATVTEAYKKAHDSDPVSIFGGIVAVNKEVNAELAAELAKIFLEIVIAPSYTEEALAILCKKVNLRVMLLPTINAPLKEGTLNFTKVAGGLLLQEPDRTLYDEAELEVVTKVQPTAAQLADLKFAYKVVKHSKSNAITVCGNSQVYGIGSGQTNRIWATEEAIARSKENAKGAVLGSDAFFPFSDCVEAAAAAGITAIIQPGGSIRDKEVIEAADKAGIAMVFCKQRHFKH